MNLHDAFERILSSLQRAALDDAHWPAAGALIDEACGVRGTAVVVGERAGGPGHVRFASYLRRGESQHERLREYFDVWYPNDPSLRRLIGRPEGRLSHIRELFTEDELKTSPAYNEGWRVLDAQDSLNVHFDDPDGLSIVWFIGDPAGGDGWQSDRLKLIERLKPHVRHFVLVRQALAAADAVGTTLTSLLDSRLIGVVHLDRSGRVLAANDLALALLGPAVGLIDRDGSLQAWLPEDNRRLQKLLVRALPSLWGEAPRGGVMNLRRRSGAVGPVLHVIPVGDAQGDFGGRRVAALALVSDPSVRPPIDPLWVAERLGLTRSEGRVAALLAEGNTVAEIVSATGYSPGYLRQLLTRVYRKQGVSGQVALVPRVLAVDALPRP